MVLTGGVHGGPHGCLVPGVSSRVFGPGCVLTGVSSRVFGHGCTHGCLGTGVPTGVWHGCLAWVSGMGVLARVSGMGVLARVSWHGCPGTGVLARVLVVFYVF